MKVASPTALLGVLRARLSETGDETRTITLSELIHEVLPYPYVRIELGLAGKAEYDLALLGLLERRDLVQVDPAVIDAVEREKDLPEPSLEFARELEDSLLRLREEPVETRRAGPRFALLEEESATVPESPDPPAPDPPAPDPPAPDPHAAEPDREARHEASAEPADPDAHDHEAVDRAPATPPPYDLIVPDDPAPFDDPYRLDVSASEVDPVEPILGEDAGVDPDTTPLDGGSDASDTRFARTESLDPGLAGGAPKLVEDDPPTEAVVLNITRSAELEPWAAGDAAAPTCGACETRLPDRRLVRFCPSCGASQLAGCCLACGTELEREWRFCPDCGEQRDRV